MKSFLRLKSVRIASALAIASGLAGTVGLVASTTSVTQVGADPASSTANVGVGADVTQDVYDALSGAAPTPGSGAANIKYYSPIVSSVASNARTISSFDAAQEPGSTTTASCITTKLGGPSFDRPNSTTAGITALLATVSPGSNTGWENSPSCTNADVSVVGQIDFARAARGPASTGSILTYIPFAQDALGFLYYDDGDASLASLSTANLTALYSGTGSVSINGQTVYACLPISTSSPVSNLKSTLHLSTAQVTAASADCNGIQQNSGDSFYNAAIALPNGVASHAVIPISAGSWIGQANGAGFDRSSLARANGVDLATVDSIVPYTGTAPNEMPNTPYYSSAYGYNIYTVVITAKLSGFGSNTSLSSLFVGSGSAICSTSAQSIVHTFGFDSLSGTEGTCGSTTTTGNT